MSNSVFVDKENILLVQDEVYDDYYRKLDIIKLDETSFTIPDTTEVASALRLRQKLKQDKIVSLYWWVFSTNDIKRKIWEIKHNEKCFKPRWNTICIRKID